MSVLARLLGVRAAANTGGNVPSPAAATAPIGWTAPGMPQTARWDADSAVALGYLGEIYSYRCARTIAVTLGSLPFRAGDNPDRPASFNPRAPLAQLLGPAPGGPAPGISPRDLWIWSIISYLVTGRFGWETVRTPGSTRVVSLWPLVAARLKPIPVTGGTAWFGGFEYWENAAMRPLTADQVFYAWRPALDDWRQPESVLQAAATQVSTSIALDKFMYAYMRNGLSANKMIVTPEWSDNNMRRAFQDQWLSEMTGFENAGRVGFAEYDDSTPDAKPNVQVLDLGTKPVDAQMVEQRQALKNDICVAYGVPMSMLGNASDRTFENADAEYRNYWTGTILPLAQELADKVNLALAPRLGSEVGWFDLSKVDALKPANLFQSEPASELVKAGIVDADEVREDLGLAARNPDTKPLVAQLPAVDDTAGDTSKTNFARRDDDVSEQLRRLTDAIRDIPVLVSQGLRYDVSPIGLGKNWVTSVGGLPLFARAIAHALMRDGHSEQRAVQLAIGVIRNWAEGKGNVTPKTRAKAAAALAEWERKKTQAKTTPNKRDAVLASSSAGLLEPAGAPAAVVKQRAHAFVSSPADKRKCKVCARGVTAKLHGLNGRGKRHAGPDGHHHTPTGHVKTLAARTRTQVDNHAADAEPQLAQVIQALFAKQQRGTMDRLLGRRGKQMLRAAEPPDAAAAQPQGLGEGAPPVNVAAVFDLTFWIDQARQAADPVLNAVTDATTTRLASQLHPGQPVFPAAIQAAKAATSARVSKLASTVTQDTYDQIAKAISDGMLAGEGIQGIAKRVRAVFATSQSRAETIARTEVMGAISSATFAYADGLPDGVVSHKQWLATPDSRTRHDHAEANGQQRDMAQPFDVGGFPMMFPHDPAAPPSEVINCRCVLLVVPARVAKPAPAAAAA